jgi:hypothetical protein
MRKAFDSNTLGRPVYKKGEKDFFIFWALMHMWYNILETFWLNLRQNSLVVPY